MYDFDVKCYDWKLLFNHPVLRNFGRNSLKGKSDQKALKFQNYLYAVMSADELKVPLHGCYAHRMQRYKPKHHFDSPIKSPRWFSYLIVGRYGTHDYYLVCLPMSKSRSRCRATPPR